MATKYAPPHVPFIRARYQGGRQTPKAVVIHGTVSSDNAGTARNIAGWWHGPTSPVTSCHYIVDPREAIQAVGDHSIAFHCGYNRNSVGIELCDEQQGPANRWKDADSQAILKRAARLTAQLCLAYGIEVKRPTIAELKRKGPHGIYGHDDSRQAFGNTSHSDPRDFDWPAFIRLVKLEVADIKGIKPPAPVDPPKHVQITDKMDPRAYFVGARGAHIKWLGDRLVAHGQKRYFANGTDTIFTKSEELAAVAAFQRKQGWTGADANGLPGKETLRLLAKSPWKRWQK